MTALVCGAQPLVNSLVVEVLLCLFLRDQGTTDGVLEISCALSVVVNDVNEIAAEGVFVDLNLDF